MAMVGKLKSGAVALGLSIALTAGLCPGAALAAQQTSTAPLEAGAATQLVGVQETPATKDLSESAIYCAAFDGQDDSAKYVEPGGTVTAPEVSLYYYDFDFGEDSDEMGRVFIDKEKYTVSIADVYGEGTYEDYTAKTLGEGFYKFKITAKDGSDYTGYQERYFRVYSKYDLEGGEVSFDESYWNAKEADYYIPANTAAKPIVKINGVTVPEANYTVTYTYADPDVDTDEVIADPFAKEGYYYCRVEGKSPYKNSQLVSFYVSAPATTTTPATPTTPAANTTTTPTTTQPSTPAATTKPATPTTTTTKPAAPTKTSLASAAISGLTAKTYTGAALTQAPVVTVAGKKLANGTDYTVSYRNNVNAGTATLTVTGKGSYEGTKSATFTIAKAANGMKAKAKSPKVKAKKLKKTKQTIAAKKAFTVSKANGKVTYKKTSGAKKVTVAKNGKVTVKKGLKKGTYKVKVKITAAGDKNHKKASKTVTLKVKVK